MPGTCRAADFLLRVALLATSRQLRSSTARRTKSTECLTCLPGKCLRSGPLPRSLRRFATLSVQADDTEQRWQALCRSLMRATHPRVCPRLRLLGRGLAAHAQRRAFEVLLSRWRKARCNAGRHGRIVTQWAGRGRASSAGSREHEFSRRSRRISARAVPSIVPRRFNHKSKFLSFGRVGTTPTVTPSCHGHSSPGRRSIKRKC